MQPTAQTDQNFSSSRYSSACLGKYIELLIHIAQQSLCSTQLKMKYHRQLWELDFSITVPSF